MVKVDTIIPGGQALGTLDDGKKIFFWNALPGEIISEYEVTKNKSRYVEAIATEIKNPSLFRVKPLDDCFLSTSPWQIIDYDYELQLKSELVAEIFREHQINITPPPVITDGHDYFYRNKMEYALYWDNNTDKISLAFHARGSHRKTSITKSSLERPEIFQKAEQIVTDLNNRHEEARKYQSLLLRCNQKGEVSGGLYENHHPHPVFKNLTDAIFGREFLYSPNGFFQINLPVYETALTEIKRYITTDKVLDLYSGVGTIGLSVASDRRLTLVECDKHAYRELCENCQRHNTIFHEEHNRRRGDYGATEPRDDGSEGAFREEDSIMPKAILAKSENTLDYIESDLTVILDPPRAGCDTKLIDRLLSVCPVRIIYLSCNPATQARDVKLLLQKYQIDTIKTFNFFPHTPHIENLVILNRK